MNIPDTSDQQAHQYSRRTWVIITAVGLVLTVGVATALLQLSDKEPPNRLEQSIEQATEATNKGDYDSALRTLQNAQPHANTKQDRVRILNELAAAAASAGQISNALEYYTEKHKLDPDSKSADGYLVGELYERSDDVAQAIMYYQLHIHYLQSRSADELRDATLRSLRVRVQELQGQQ